MICVRLSSEAVDLSNLLDLREVCFLGHADLADFLGHADLADFADFLSHADFADNADFFDFADN